MNTKSILSVVGLVVLGILAVPAEAQLIVDISSKAESGQLELGGTLSNSEIDYDGQYAGGGDVDRSVLGVYAAYGISARADFYIGAGYILDTKPQQLPEDGDGFLVAAGTRCLVMERDRLYVLAYGQLQYVSEDYGSESYVSGAARFHGYYGDVVVTREADATSLEVSLGVVGKYVLADTLSVYAALEAVPYCDGESDVSYDSIAYTGTDNIEYERDSIINVRFGAHVDLQTWLLRAELTTLGEQGLRIGAGKRF